MTPQKLEQAKKIFDGLQHGTIDRTLFTDNANAYFSEEAVKDFAEGLAPLGTPQSFVQAGPARRDDSARVPHPIPAESPARLDLRNAGRKVGAVSDRDGELNVQKRIF